MTNCAHSLHKLFMLPSIYHTQYRKHCFNLANPVWCRITNGDMHRLICDEKSLKLCLLYRCAVIFVWDMHWLRSQDQRQYYMLRFSPKYIKYRMCIAQIHLKFKQYVHVSVKLHVYTIINNILLQALMPFR